MIVAHDSMASWLSSLPEDAQLSVVLQTGLRDLGALLQADTHWRRFGESVRREGALGSARRGVRPGSRRAPPGSRRGAAGEPPGNLGDCLDGRRESLRASLGGSAGLPSGSRRAVVGRRPVASAGGAVGDPL